MRRPHLPRRLARLRLPPPRRKSPVFEIALIIGLGWYAVTLGFSDYDFSRGPAWAVIDQWFSPHQVAAIAGGLALALFNTRWHRPDWWYLTVRALAVGAMAFVATMFFLAQPSTPAVGVYVGGAVALALTLGGLREW